jgi:competence protein ComGC
MKDPNEGFNRIMILLFWFVVSYFIIVFIPQLLNKLL